VSKASTSTFLQFSTCLFLILVASLTAIAPKGAEATAEAAVSGEFLISLKETSEDVISLIEANNGVILEKIDVINILRVRIEGVSTQTFTESLRDNPSVLYVEPNGIVSLPVQVGTEAKASDAAVTLTPSDTFWFSDPLSGLGQWNMRVVNAEQAWDVQTGSRSVVVAVLDTGVFRDHSDLKASYMTGGYDWVNNDSNPADDHGHGTAVAGIIAAETNNGYGIAGLAQVSVVAEKVLDRSGTGTWANVASGIIHATDLGADVISMSFAGHSPSATVKSAVNYAYGKGCLLVAAAGNGNTNTPSYPAAFDKVLAVAATYGEPDLRAPYSDFGDWITLSAPGGFDANRNGRVDLGEHWVLSTYGVNNFIYLYGTSLAAPHVSGLAALYKSKYPTATNTQIEAVLKATADEKGDSGWDQYYGYGRINAYRALTTPPVPLVGGQAELLQAPDENPKWTSHTPDPFLVSCSFIAIVAVLLLTVRKNR